MRDVEHNTVHQNGIDVFQNLHPKRDILDLVF